MKFYWYVDKDDFEDVKAIKTKIIFDKRTKKK